MNKYDSENYKPGKKEEKPISVKEWMYQTACFWAVLILAFYHAENYI